MTTIGIVAAMQREARPLLRLSGGRRAGRIGGCMAWCFSTGPHRCVLMVSGMGLQPAREAVRALAAVENPQLIVSFGIAGALGSGMEIGDIFMGERCRTWENGVFGPPSDLAALPEAARAAASRAAERRGARCHHGMVISVRGLQEVPAPSEGEAVVEMETWGIAQAAAERGIPAVSLRAISDSPGAPIPFSMAGGEEFRLKPLVLLGAILRRPGVLLSLLRLKRNADLASRNLAEVVTAVICLPGLTAIGKP